MESSRKGSTGSVSSIGHERIGELGFKVMVPSFNTAGPCVPGEHYMLSPLPRLREVMALIDGRKYFALHAGHQTGKTTCARWLVQHYNSGERHACVWIDLQSAREIPDPAVAFRVVLEKIAHAARRDLPTVKLPDLLPLLATPQTAIVQALQALSSACPRPLTVLIDEADCLIGPTMVSFLTQIREGYIDRSVTPFPHSLVLIGRRQVRDYVLVMDDRKVISWLGTSSPFNITAEAPTLGMFSADDVAALLAQHTDHTGQRFLPPAVGRIFELSQGHPWLVNALADQVVNRDVQDRSVAITAEHIDSAKETLIQERRSHIDSLIARLNEDRVRHIIEPMLAGENIGPYDSLNDDLSYVLGLGILAKRGGGYEIANPIYREVIPRVLSYDQQMLIQQRTEWYRKADGGLDLPKIMAAWQEFWREDGHLAAAGFRYREAGPHLMLMAFLQRIVNGGGQINREYGLGRRALDLLLFWPLPSGQVERHVIEIKLRRDQRSEGRGIVQISSYLDSTGLTEGWLVFFDLRKGRSWKERLFNKKRKHGAHVIRVVGC